MPVKFAECAQEQCSPAEEQAFRHQLHTDDSRDANPVPIYLSFCGQIWAKINSLDRPAFAGGEIDKVIHNRSGQVTCVPLDSR